MLLLRTWVHTPRTPSIQHDTASARSNNPHNQEPRVKQFAGSPLHCGNSPPRKELARVEPPNLQISYFRGFARNFGFRHFEASKQNSRASLDRDMNCESGCSEPNFSRQPTTSSVSQSFCTCHVQSEGLERQTGDTST